MSTFDLELRLQVALFRQRQVLEGRPVRVAVNDGGDTLVVMVRPFVKAFFWRAGGARNGQI